MTDKKSRTRAQYPFRCSTPVQLRFSDIDMLGHLNNNAYLQIYDLGKNDYFAKVRPGYVKWSRPPLMIVNLNCSFLSQTRFHEPVEVLTQVERMGDKSFVMMQQVVNAETGEVKSECESVMVYFDDEGHPAHVADDWRHDIAIYEQREL